MFTIQESIDNFIKVISLSRSQNTTRTYKNAMQYFAEVLKLYGVSTSLSVNNLSEDSVSWLALELKNSSPATERLYLAALSRYFEYLVAEDISPINLSRVRLLKQQRMRRTGQRLPQFPKSEIVTILNYVNNIAIDSGNEEKEHLRSLRDRAFLITLADTGLRVHEACQLRRGDIDWNEAKAIVIGKGDQQAIVRFSKRSLEAIRDYLNHRKSIDHKSGRPLISLPLFSRHDRGAGKKVKPITTATGRNIVNQRALEALGSDSPNINLITPHSFRHYFVTTVLLASNGNLKLAQELARHKNISVTQRYAHLSDGQLDEGYDTIFN